MGAASCPGMGGRGGRAIGAGVGAWPPGLRAPPRGVAFRVASRRRTCASPASGEFPSALRSRGTTAGSLCGVGLFSGCSQRPSPTPPTPACARSGALALSRFARRPGVSARPPAAAARAPPPPLLAGPAPTTLPRPRVPRERPRHTRTRAHTHQPHGRASRRAAGTRRTRASRSSGGQPRPQLPLRESLEPHSSPEPRRRPARPPSRESGPPRPSACWLLGCSLPGALPRALPPASCIPPSRRCAVDGGPRAGSALSPGSAELLSPATRATSPPAPRPDGT